MRRPLKPFVTEYKPSSRRQSASGRSVQPAEGEAAFAPKPNGSPRLEASDRDVNHRSEDSYEAALRAADALFSPARKAGTGDDRAPDGDEGVEHPRSAPAKGGRILRVIDEPPSEVLTVMEEERGPQASRAQARIQEQAEDPRGRRLRGPHGPERHTIWRHRFERHRNKHGRGCRPPLLSGSALEASGARAEDDEERAAIGGGSQRGRLRRGVRRPTRRAGVGRFWLERGRSPRRGEAWTSTAPGSARHARPSSLREGTVAFPGSAPN